MEKKNTKIYVISILAYNMKCKILLFYSNSNIVGQKLAQICLSSTVGSLAIFISES